MPSKLSDDLLTLLALTVFADRRVFAEEIETFMDVAAALQNDLGLQPKVSAPRLLLWFENHRDDLRTALRAPDFETRLTALLTRLRSLPDKRPILGAMAKIAKADNDVHVSEKALIVLAKRAWG